MGVIPDLIEEYLLSNKGDKTTANGSGGGAATSGSGSATSGGSELVSSSTLVANKENHAHATASSTTASSTTISTTTTTGTTKGKSHQSGSDEKEKRLVGAVNELRGILAVTPKGLAGLREGCLSLRKVVKQISDLASNKARLGLLADVLALWAHTSNYSSIQVKTQLSSSHILSLTHIHHCHLPCTLIHCRSHYLTRSPLHLFNRCILSNQAYNPVESDSLPVVARELGTNIPRAKITSVATVPAIASVSAQGQGLVVEEMKTSSSSQNDPLPHIHSHTTNGKESSKDASMMEPNEVVFLGHKTYDKHFIFWQLIGWFHAGTDQKAEAPDLFGCVQLPLPAACFGTSEMQYGLKQRESLLAHLREEKAQTLPWPPLVKACFETSHVKALATR